MKTISKYFKILFEDMHLRTNISLYVTLILNTVYAIFQFGLGAYYSSFWYYSLTGYYATLAVMRFFLLKYTRKYSKGENFKEELIRYRICGYIFLLLNISLTLIIFFMIYFEKTFIHHEITAIAMAAYTFVAFTLAVINIIKYRKYKSPVYSASKAISLAAACVSMITLTSTMLTAFSKADDIKFRSIMLTLIGTAVSIFILTLAIYMIIQSTKKIKGINMDNKENTAFKYKYSAKEQAEVKKIRGKYTQEKIISNISDFERVKKLDEKVTKKASAAALCTGIINTLIMGFGMSLIMTDIGDILRIKNALQFGIIIGFIGIIGIVSAYPIYQKVLISARKKIAPEILKMTDDLI